jgi:hypothetical protein
MNELPTLIRNAERAMDGDSNDAEHDALYELVQFLKGCQHTDGEDCMICSVCGRCDETLDEKDDICDRCRAGQLESPCAGCAKSPQACKC